MRNFVFLFLISFIFNPSVQANWVKINDVDYVWGPFKIYNITLFSESGEYVENTRPLMLTLKYAKPVDGRDFAISLARSWSNLGITLKDQDSVVDRLRKIMPNIKKDDVLSYIALEDKGYFVLNDIIIPEEFNKEFNDAVVAVWLDTRVEIGRKLIQRKEQDKTFVANMPQVIDSQNVSVESSERKLNEQNAENTMKNKSMQEITPVNTDILTESQTEKTSAVTDSPKVEQKNETKVDEPVLKKPKDDAEIEIIPAVDPMPQQIQPIS